MLRRYIITITVFVLFAAAGHVQSAYAQTPLSNGERLPGAIALGEVDEWTFTATAGATVILRVGTEFAPYLALYAPDGTFIDQRLGNGGDRDAVLGVAAPQTGAYRVVVAGRFGMFGNYHLTLALIPGTPQVSPGDEGGPMTNGLTHMGTLPVGDFDQWTFTAAAGTAILVKMGAQFSPYLGLYGPNGALVTQAGANSGSGETGMTVLSAPATGAYTVIASNSFAGSGNYAVTLALIPAPAGTPQVSPDDQGGPMTNGLTYPGALYGGDMDQWTFNASAGERLAVRIGAAFAPYLALYGPNGTRLAERAANGAAGETSVDATAPLTGVYTVIVLNAFIGGSGNYSLTFAQIPGTPQVSPGDQGGRMTNGVSYPGAFYVGDMDQWTFTAAAGASLNVHITATFAPYIGLYGPNGALVAEHGANVSGLEAEVTATAPSSGTYTVLVLDAFVGGNGTYQIGVTGASTLSNLHITKLASVASAAPGAPVNFTLNVSNLGPETATNVIVTDAVPAALTIVSCTASGGAACVAAANTRTVTFPSLAANATAAVTIATTVSCSPVPAIVNTATVAGLVLDTEPTNNTASVTVTVPNTPTADDSDGDGLPNEWETRFGLNPNSACGDDGRTGNPDHDTVTNEQELTLGTHPRGFYSSFLPEGARNAFFDARFAVLNVGNAAGRLLFRFLQSDGNVLSHFVNLPQNRRLTIDGSLLSQLTTPDFSTGLESDQPIVLDRTMTWASGRGSHAETGVPQAATTWYLAEGATAGEFSLFYLLQNPNPTAAVATVKYLLPNGLAPITMTYPLPANSRTTIFVDDQDARLAETDVSAVITTPAGAPIIVERAMYKNTPSQSFAAGHGSSGVTAPATRWFFAEGATGPFFDCFILLANPGTAPAGVTIHYLLDDGRTFTKDYTVPAEGRLTVYLDAEEIPAGSGNRPLEVAAVSSTVESDVPIIAERAMWWPGPGMGGEVWSEAHNSPGATATSTRWALAEGEVGGDQAAETYVLIANTSTTPGVARVTLYFEDGTSAEQTFALLPRSRRNVNVSTDFPSRPTTRFATVVDSLPSGGNPAAEIVVERAMYTSPGGAAWEAGTNALASRR
jgi:uncharacterized repeat protein (TIGR01451 family)